ncbi:probable cytochrome P450 4aa1 isoform X2 [Leptinotarsa decemlineata]
MKYLLASSAVVILFLIYIRTYLRSVYLALKLPGPKALPIIGNVLFLNDDREMEHLGNKAHELYGSFMRFWVSFLPCIVVHEPRHLNIILGTNRYSRKNIFYTLLHNFLGQGLITNNGYAWKKNRKMIQSLFHTNIQEIFIETFQDCAEAFVSKLNGLTDVKITALVNDCVLDILHNAILGVPLDKNSPYRKGQVILNDRLTKPWLLLETIFSRTTSAQKEIEQKTNLHSYTKKILLERRKGTRSGKCFLDMFIEIANNNLEFTDEDIINEIVTFMLAGQDSLGSAVAFTLFHLAKYHDIQNRVLKEISDYEEGTKLSNKELFGMKYLEQVIKETLRLAPSVPIFARVLTEDVVLDDVEFPRGTNIFISPFLTHRHPQIYPDPLKFDPDRFSTENVENRHPFAYLPFSLGPRKCIGYQFALMEMKTIIFTILKKYELSLVPGHEEYTLTYRTTLRAKGGIWIRLKARK